MREYGLDRRLDKLHYDCPCCSFDKWYKADKNRKTSGRQRAKKEIRKELKEIFTN